MRILITGVTGTIGRAFVDLLQSDHQIVGVDRNEEGVAKFRQDYPDVDISVGDFGDIDFVRNGIDLLIHLAAMKHIDLCEANPNECVSNNVIKTYHLFKRAYNNYVNILFASTDKAVRPVSTYGYSKALCESMVLGYGGSFFRSGNVVASTGSVLGVWDDAIKNLQPIKVTHKDMRRYFVSPENLVKRVWKQYSEDKHVIIPKMDREVGIMELLAEKLESYEFTIDNYPGGIKYIGLRPNEKLTEELEWPIRSE